jgi:hypothetical protein
MRSSPLAFCLFLCAAVDPIHARYAPRATNPAFGSLPDPSTYQSPRFRYFWPNGWIDPTEIETEVAAIAAAGFGGAEISDVCDSIDVPMDTSLYGWGQPRWNAGADAAFETGNSLGLHMDYTVGPQWPTGVPGYTPDSPETAKELCHGVVLLNAGASHSGSLPQPSTKPSGVSTANPTVNTTLNLLAVFAAETTATAIHTIMAFDPSTLVDLTSTVAGNGTTLNWTAPSNGTYVLVAVYSRGTGQIQSQFDGNPDAPQLTDPGPAYIVDHFSAPGVQASVDYWNSNILSSSLRTQLAASEGSLFEDSLELEQTQFWTTNFTTEFQTRRGYDLKPYLLYVLADGTFTGDADMAARVQYDFYLTLSDLYIGYRLTGLKAFANSLGLKMRAQPYYVPFDSARAAAFLDIPEGESLGFKSTPDAFRILAAGRDIAQKTPILSCELGAVANAAYSLTWKALFTTMNAAFSYGVSQSVIHGFPYRDSPDSKWPGYHAFTPHDDATGIGYTEAWGPRQPQWIFAPMASKYMARAQVVQQTGVASVDLAIISTTWDVGTRWSDQTLAKAGFSYQVCDYIPAYCSGYLLNLFIIRSSQPLSC